jgi:hypothetical protein
MSRVHTREVVRNLIDASEGWEDWNVDRYTALRISADRIIDRSSTDLFAKSGFRLVG